MTERRIFAGDCGLEIDQIDFRAVDIVLTLQDAGFEAYIVGGGVRDLLLGKNPKDFDIATSAHPEEIRSLFKNCRLIGRRFRLAHIFFRNHIIEVATFRGDHTQADHEGLGSTHESGLILRDNVFGTLEEDACRRDFTINALYYDPASEEILDFTGGIDDLYSRTLRLIGDPEKRFHEDPVRLLRAARFVGKLGLTVEPKTAAAMGLAKNLLQQASPSRLFDEYSKFFLHGHATEVFEALGSFGLLNFLFPHIDSNSQDLNIQKMTHQALLNTDARIAEGKSLNPAFLLAVFLWHPMQEKQREYLAQSNAPYDAYLQATNTVLSEQVNCLAIPKRLTQTIREIWYLQHLLERRRPRQVLTLLHHKRFRAAYDFLLLRSEIGEVPVELAEWWTVFQTLTIAQQKEWIRGLNSAKKHSEKNSEKNIDFLDLVGEGGGLPSNNDENGSQNDGKDSAPTEDVMADSNDSKNSKNYESLWSQLSGLAKKHRTPAIKTLFQEDWDRFIKFSVEGAGIFLDFSKNRITDESFNLLIELAHESNLAEKIDQLFSGDWVNNTEKRPALHMACRAKGLLEEGFPEEGFPEEVIEKVLAEKSKMREFVSRVHSGQWTGETGERITDIVNLGIGGSDLGPHMVIDALRADWTGHLKAHFVSNIDGAALEQVLNQLDPTKTLFILASKSFSTQETLQNAKTARDWLVKKLGPKATEKHFIAITSKPKLAEQFGMKASSCFEMWDFVGGRYSLWSAIGLPIALMIGMDNFEQLLSGARAMDQHFKDSDFNQNLPVILAMLGVWYRNLWNFETHAVLPYDDRLGLFPSYLQQLDMESNGKRVSQSGKTLHWQTGPVIWGGVGTNGQHAFHQLLHQGTSVIPADFILVKTPHHHLKDHHEILLSHGLAQMQALMNGKTEDEAYRELVDSGMNPSEAQTLAPHKVIIGNKPCNAIVLNKLTPEALGALIALYEHKVFVQSVIWGINPFDQWGVELGKQLAGPLLKSLHDKKSEDFDASTNGLIRRLIF